MIFFVRILKILKKFFVLSNRCISFIAQGIFLENTISNVASLFEPLMKVTKVMT